MTTFTCEYIVHQAYRDHFDFHDDNSLASFHGWIGKRVADALLKKYGRTGLDVIHQGEIWEDDLGLIADCDFHELAAGSMCVTFSRTMCPHSGIRGDNSYSRFTNGTLEHELQTSLAHAYAE